MKRENPQAGKRPCRDKHIEGVVQIAQNVSLVLGTDLGRQGAPAGLPTILQGHGVL